MDPKSRLKIEQKIKKLRVDLSYVESDMIAGNLAYEVISRRNNILTDIAVLEGQLKETWNKGYEPDGISSVRGNTSFDD
jgi:hypothetical protein